MEILMRADTFKIAIKRAAGVVESGVAVEDLRAIKFSKQSENKVEVFGTDGKVTISSVVTCERSEETGQFIIASDKLKRIADSISEKSMVHLDDVGEMVVISTDKMSVDIEKIEESEDFSFIDMDDVTFEDKVQVEDIVQVIQRLIIMTNTESHDIEDETIFFMGEKAFAADREACAMIPFKTEGEYAFDNRMCKIINLMLTNTEEKYVKIGKNSDMSMVVMTMGGDSMSFMITTDEMTEKDQYMDEIAPKNIFKVERGEMLGAVEIASIHSQNMEVIVNFKDETNINVWATSDDGRKSESGIAMLLLEGGEDLVGKTIVVNSELVKKCLGTMRTKEAFFMVDEDMESILIMDGNQATSAMLPFDFE